MCFSSTKLQDKFKIGIYLHLFLIFLRESFKGCDQSFCHSYKIENKGSVWSEADQESLLFAKLTNFNEIEKKKNAQSLWILILLF